MSRQSNIRWQKSDSEELRKAVKNFNAKISRLEKKNPEIKEVLPDKVSARTLKKMIKTRQDLKREINTLKRFSKKGSEEIETYGDYNIKVTKWQRQEMNRRLPNVNKKRAERLEYLENIELKYKGESLGYTKGDIGMGRMERTGLQPLKGITKGMSQRDIGMKWKMLVKESQSGYHREKDYLCRENYIKGIEDEFNWSTSKAKVGKIVSKIKNMDIDEFLETFYSEQDAHFDEIYRPNDDEYENYLNKLEAVWL